MKKSLLLKSKVIISLVVIFVLSFPFSLFNINLPAIIFLSTKLSIINLIVVGLLLCYIILSILIKIKFLGRKSTAIMNNLVDNVFIISILTVLASFGYYIGIVVVVVFISFVLNIFYDKKEVDRYQLWAKVVAYISIIIALLNDFPLAMYNIYLHNFIDICLVGIYMANILKMIYDGMKIEKSDK